MGAWLQVVGGVLATLLSATGVLRIIEGLLGRRRTKADIIDRLGDTQLKWVEQFQEDAAGARHEASAARREAGDARREAADARREAVDALRALRDVTAEVEAISLQVRAIRTWIHEPSMTIERLRRLVPLSPPGPPPANGHAAL